MKKIILGLFIAIGFSACDVNDVKNDYPDCGTYLNMSFGSYPIDCNYSIKTIPTSSGVLVVKSQEKMDSFFTKKETSCDDTTIPKTIDFTKNYLVGIFAGPKSTPGYEIKISSILENDCEVVVQFYEKETTSNSESSSTLKNPYDFILIPKTDKPIYFNKVSEVTNYIVLGSYTTNATQNLFSETDINIKQYLNLKPDNYNIATYNFQSLTNRGQYTEFLKTIPTEIVALSDKTKTYGNPNGDGREGVYFQLSKNGVLTTIHFDKEDTEDQSAEIIAFKKTLIQRILNYKQPIMTM